MRTRRATLLTLLAVTLALAGCLHGPNPEEVRDGFVESVEDVESYSYEGETQFEIDGGPGTPTQTTTVSTNAALDRDDRELRAETTSTKELRGESSTVELTTYLVNGSVYDLTESGGDEPEWLRYDRPREVEEEWSSRDELGLYSELLQQANMSHASASEEAEGSQKLLVELGPEEQVELLESKFGDQAGFFSDVDVEEFEMHVWISEDESRLDRAEAEISMTVEPEDQTPTILYIDASFEDDFSGYDEAVNIELPEEASDARRVTARSP